MLSLSTSSWQAYRQEVHRPLVCLVFVAPMLVCYELAMLVLGPQAMRNGADVWLRELLDSIGFGQYLLLPLLTVGILLGWHHVERQKWSFESPVLLGMLAESLLFAGLLIGIAESQHAIFKKYDLLALDQEHVHVLAYFGAGIYEELMFRLMLLPALMSTLKLIGASNRTQIVWGVVISSLLFSIAHYDIVTSYGDSFQWFSFSFRFIAGCIFCWLFLKRGFGITVGTHALYDILVTVG